VIGVWLLTGPLFGFGDTWQLVVNTGTTIVTFLPVEPPPRRLSRSTIALGGRFDGRDGRTSVIRLEIADRTDRLVCEQCGGAYRRVYGTVYDDGRRAARYSADLHEEAHDGRVLLVIGADGGRSEAVVIGVWSTESEYQMMIQDRSAFPHQDGLALGRILDRDEALRSPSKDELFHIADHIVQDDPRVRSHLEA
jgi:hypothetical protein